MKTKTVLCPPDKLDSLSDILQGLSPDVALIFADRETLENKDTQAQLKTALPCRSIMTSTAGQISGTTVSDGELSITVIDLEKSRLDMMEMALSEYEDEYHLGRSLYEKLYEQDIAGLMVFADGTSINGSKLKDGLESMNLNRTPITGGLAGDGTAFEKTLVGIDSASEQRVVGLAFYGDKMEVGSGSRGGWQHERTMYMVSGSQDNVLKNIEGEPALDFYSKKLMGKLVNMPADALKYPLGISDPMKGYDIVRTILNVDEDSKSMTFAGDIPLMSNVRFLKATNEELIMGSRAAATLAKPDEEASPELAILVSCVGRKLVLEEDTQKEVEAVGQVMGKDTALCGFYSYGELSPSEASGRCELHNQTMTITTLRERA